MTRAFGLIVVLVSLALTGVLFSKESSALSPTSGAVKRDESQAVAIASASIFTPVTQVIQVDYAEAGTYVGAELPAGSGVVLAQATSTTYCLEANVNGTLVHEVGPGGSPALGAC